jgi:hypothetical protein
MIKPQKFQSITAVQPVVFPTGLLKKGVWRFFRALTSPESTNRSVENEPDPFFHAPPHAVLGELEAA